MMGNTVTIIKKLKKIQPKLNENSPILTKIINKGTGAGGANTNKNGLPYEKLTDLQDKYKYYDLKNNEVIFEGYDRKFIKTSKSVLHKYMKQIGQMNQDILSAPGCKAPDEAYIDIENKIAYIIEKKFQQTSGSVDEKLQTGRFKKSHYKTLFPEFTIYYIYCLSDWFKKEDYESTRNYLKEDGIPIFWGSSDTYKQEIIEFIHNSL